MRTAQRIRTPSADELSGRAANSVSDAGLPRCPLCGGAWDGAAAVQGAPHYAQMRRRGSSEGAAGPLALLRAAACHGCRSSLDDSALSAPASLGTEVQLLPGPVAEEAHSVRRWVREQMRCAPLRLSRAQRASHTGSPTLRPAPPPQRRHRRILVTRRRRRPGGRVARTRALSPLCCVHGSGPRLEGYIRGRHNYRPIWSHGVDLHGLRLWSAL